MPPMAGDDLTYRIDIWTPDGVSIERTMARLGNLAVARAAFRETVRIYPAAVITLRQGAHLLEKHNLP